MVEEEQLAWAQVGRGPCGCLRTTFSVEPTSAEETSPPHTSMTAPPPPGFSTPQPPTYAETTGINSPPYPYPYPAPGQFTGPPMKAGQDPSYPAQPYPGQPGTAAGPAPVTVQAVFVQSPISFHDRPLQLCCPSCNKTIVTRVVHTSGALTWLSCAGLCLVGCGLGCCLIPFCVDSLQDAQHYCPECQTHLGTFKRL